MKRPFAVRGAVLFALLAGTLLAEVLLAPSPVGAQDDIILQKAGTTGRAKPDHFTRYSPPSVDELPADARVHIIQPGDTLWDIAQAIMGDPYLWPQIWEVNRYITDPHWIYPGDPLVIPRPMMITDLEPVDDLPDLNALPPPKPVAKRSDIYCAPYIVARSSSGGSDRMEPSYSDASDAMGGSGSVSAQAPQIMESEADKLSFATGDVLYINRGEAHGVAAGDEFMVVHPSGTAQHPRTKRTVGAIMQMVGTLKVLCTQQDTSTVMVETACDSLARGDLIRPLEPLPIPLASEFRESDRRCGVDVDRPQGVIVNAKDFKVALSQEDIVNIDMGSEAGLVPGDFLVIYRQNRLGPNYPLQVLGDLVVLLVEPSTATAKILASNDDMRVGDSVKLR